MKIRRHSSQPLDSAQTADVAEIAETDDVAPERQIVADMLRRSVLFAVPLIAFGALVSGWSGVASASLALALVLINLVLGAAAIGWGARIGGAAMMGIVMGGYVLHLVIVTATVLPIRNHEWFDVLPFAVSLLVAHIGLLIVESRHISASAAFPGLKPGAAFGTPRHKVPSPMQTTELERTP